MTKAILRGVTLLVAAGLAAAACESGTGPGEDRIVDLAFQPSTIALGADASATVVLENRGNAPEGPIQLTPGAVTRDGSNAAGVHLQAVPAEVPTLNPGQDVTLTVSLVFDVAPTPGHYEASLAARLHGEDVSSVALEFSAAAPPMGGSETLSISAGPASPRQGDVVTYEAETRDSTGAEIDDPTLTWHVTPQTAGLMLTDGRFVGYEPGPARIVAQASGLADTLDIDIAPRGLAGSFQTVGQGGITTRFTSDVWVHGDHAYTGTWSCRGTGACGDRLHVWDVATPASPTLTHSVLVDARVVNDVKVRADGQIGVITHELSNDGLNGISLLDLADPAHPVVVARYTSGLESGVHNVWIEGDYVYLVVDGVGNGLRIMNISNPAAPTIVASYYAGSSFLHDVYVRDGLAFLSHWNAGLVILDVGNGIVGGSPTNPIAVSSIQTMGGQTHNAWYWPDAGYVFVGEEDFGTPGVMHVVDASNLLAPQEVATFRATGATPHNFWLDEDRGILYAAWYDNGIRAIDVTGSLLGQLDRQGREIANADYGSGVGCPNADATCTWAPQLHGGLIYASDMNTGLWVLDPTF